MKNNNSMKKIFLVRFSSIVLMAIIVIGIITGGILRFNYLSDRMNEIHNEVADMLKFELAHYKWWINLSSAVNYHTEFTGEMDETKCAFGLYLYGHVKETEDMAGFYSKAEPLHREIHGLADEIMRLNETDTGQAVTLLTDGAETRIHELVKLLDQEIEEKQQFVTKQEGVITVTFMGVLFICLLAVAAMIWFVIHTYRYVKKKIIAPTLHLQEECELLAQGRLDLSFDMEIENEIGTLAGSLDCAVKEIKKYIDAIGWGMGAFSEGNFSVECPVKFIGDFASIQTSIESFQAKMNGMLWEMGNSIDQVTSSAEAMAEGAQDLAEGSTEQAGSVQNLTSLVADMTELIHRNASYVQETDEHGKKAERIIGENQLKMQELVAAIADIAETSEGIKEIINTIDAIAEETNLLALNASIEAARAGASGKGFAVVAGEIGKLASESTEAAKDTTDLIEKSVAHIERGKALTNTASDAFTQVAQSAERILHMVDKIATESLKQASAASGISNGIEEISGVIQTNAAISEESAASSEELNAQTQVMSGLISQFRLKHK